MAPPRIAAPLALVAMSLAVGGSGAAPLGAGQASITTTTTKTRINYVIGAHPDDEFLGWSLVEKRSDVYPVFVIFTKGEATGFGKGTGHQSELAEAHPGGTFSTARYGPELKAQRVASWHRFLDLMAAVDGSLGIPTEVSHGSRPDGAYPFEVQVGRDSARVIFDSGDGSLDQHEVADMIWVLRRHVAPGRFPAIPEGDIIGTSYSNLSDGSAQPYAHNDHKAVHEALWNVDFGMPGHQYARTTHSDPNRDVVASVTRQGYQAAMGVDPQTCQRTGAMQRAYGWLAFSLDGNVNPCPGSWDAAEHDHQAINSRVQHWWVRF